LDISVTTNSTDVATAVAVEVTSIEGGVFVAMLGVAAVATSDRRQAIDIKNQNLRYDGLVTRHLSCGELGPEGAAFVPFAVLAQLPVNSTIVTDILRNVDKIYIT
jgi:hypothetical protein